MNHSVYSADRATHLKVVGSVLLLGIVIVATALAARLTHPEAELRNVRTQTVQQPRSGHALTEISPGERRPI